MPLLSVGRLSQEDYDGDHNALLSQINALRTLVTQAAPKRVAGTGTPFAFGTASGSSTSGSTGGGSGSSSPTISLTTVAPLTVNGSTSASGTSFTLAASGAGSGTVTSFGVASVPSWLTASVATATTTPSLTLSATTGLAFSQVLATDPATGALVVRPLAKTDIPSGLPYVSIVEVGGTAFAQEPKLNLIAGTNVTISAADNPGSTRTDVTISASGGGGGTASLVQINSGSSEPSEPIINFIAGSGVTLSAADDPTNTRTNVTIDSTSGTTLAGDVTGPIGSNTVAAFGGQPYLALSPGEGYGMIYTTAAGGTWRPAMLAGDCSGALTANEVDAWRGISLDPTLPTNGQVFAYNALMNTWVVSSPPQFADNESLGAGTVNVGTLSQDFTLANTPTSGSVHLYVDSSGSTNYELLRVDASNFTVSGNTLSILNTTYVTATWVIGTTRFYTDYRF